MRCGGRLDAALHATTKQDDETSSLAPGAAANWLAADLKASRSAAPASKSGPTSVSEALAEVADGLRASSDGPRSAAGSQKETRSAGRPAKPVRPPTNGRAATSRAPVPPPVDEPRIQLSEPKSSPNSARSTRVNGAVSAASAPALPPAPVVPPALAARASEHEASVDPVDAGFEAIFAPEGKTAPKGSAKQPMPEEPVQLFKELALSHLNPVRDLLVELAWGEARKEWLDVCRPAVASLHRSSQQLQNQELSEALQHLATALEHQPSNGKLSFSETQKRSLERAYAAVAKLLPNTEPVETDRKRRETFIVQSVLQQVPGLGKLHLDRIYASGVTKLSMLCAANADELAVTTGIPRDVAEAVVAQFAYFRGRMAAIEPDLQRSGERARLVKFVSTLRRQNETLGPGSQGWSRDARQERQRLRQERGETILQVNILLARLGEVALIERLERMPFERKADELEQFLRTLEHKYEHS
jgi:hypothetical protein